MTQLPPDDRPAPFDSATDPDFARTLIQAMDNFADNAHAPAFDATAIARRTRRRRSLVAVAASAAAVALTAGTAFALHPSHQPTGQSTTAAHTPSGNPTMGTPSPVPSTSPGPDAITVPSVIGMPKVEAERLLTAAELRIGAIHDFHDWKVPAGAIMETDPRRGTRVAPGSSITLFISKGKP